MSGLTVPVNAPGLNQTSADFDKLDASATKGAKAMVGASASADKVSKSMEVLQKRMMSGEVIRNASATFALMATQGTNLNDKITALTASLASVPGPVGLVAAGVAAASTIFGIFSKEAKAAADEVDALGKQLVDLGKARVAGLDAVADRISGAAMKIGMALRGATASGATSAGIDRVAEIAGGDPTKQLGFASQLAESDLSAPNQEQVVGILEAARNAGVEITKDVVAKAIAQAKDRLAADTGSQADIDQVRASTEEAGMRGGGGFVGGYNHAGPREKMGRADQIVDLMDPTSGDRSKAVDRLNRSFTQSAYAEQAALRAAERPVLAEGARTIGDATRSFGTVEQEALIKATVTNAQSTDTLTKSIVELDKTIKETTGKQGEAKTKAYSGWRSWFNGDEPTTSP